MAQHFDHIIIATGIVPRTPRIEGVSHASVLSYLDVLLHKKPVGKRVAVIGAGGIGFDVAEYLLHDPSTSLPIPLAHWFAEWGVDPQATQNGGLIAPVVATPFRQIFLLQRKSSKLGAGLGKTSGWVHRATLQRNQVEMLAGVEYQRIDDKGLHISINGETRLLEVDNVILCAGQDSLTELMPGQVTENGPRFYKIGGAALASELDAKRAIREGAVLAASL